ncbi:MAG: Gfo/Idh/MocA family oxidoreductase [bacterium]|jgi:predicted dehydrogenase|nr:Gfo/Idh/MocA family oxidoreductase [bacterium]
MSRPISRRTFIHRASALAALSAAPTIIPSTVLGKDGAVAANERIQVGCIGVGSRGTDDLRGFLNDKNAQVVALCDVKANVLQEKQTLVNEFYGNTGCQTYADFRDLVVREDIDACLVATCDHWHVLAALAVVRSGKDVYMEKPMGLTLQQDQAMRRAVHYHNRIFQFGTQQRSDPKFRLACELARSGKIGNIHTINVWAPGSSAGGDPTPVPVPEGLDYDFWLGPAPFKPYTQDRCSNTLWWFISDYALGFIAGWGIHPLDVALWGAPDKFKGPWRVNGKGKFPTEGVADTAMDWDITFTMGSGCTMRYTGNPCPPEWRERYGDDAGHGTVFEGDEGWIYVHRGLLKTYPENLIDPAQLVQLQDQYMNSTFLHVTNFLDAVRSRQQPLSDIDVSVLGDTICHVSDIAIRLGRELTFDPEKERFLQDKEANQRLRGTMRKPWHL